MAEWCIYRFFAQPSILLEGIVFADHATAEWVSPLQWPIFCVVRFRLSNVNKVLLLWNFLSVSPKAIHNDFFLKGLNVTFFNLPQNMFFFCFRDITVHLTELSERDTLELTVNQDRLQPGRLSVHTCTESQPNCSSKTYTKSICMMNSDTISCNMIRINLMGSFKMKSNI